MNQLEKQRISKDLIDIIRSDTQISNNRQSLEVVAMMFLIAYNNPYQPLSNIKQNQIIHFIRDEINKINSKLLNAFDQFLEYINVGTLLTFDSCLRSYDINRIYLSSVFEEIIYEQAQNLSMSRGVFIQPAEVTEFMCKLVEDKDRMVVYNPFSGLGSYGVKLNNGYHYVGQEINQLIWAIGWTRLFLNSSFCLDFENKDSVNNWLGNNYNQFDLIISTPPFGGIDNSEEFLVKNSIESLKETGKLVCLLSEGFFFNSNKSCSSLRKDIVENGYVEMVISLPLNTMYTTTIKTSILVLNKNKNQNDIKFIDGSDFFINDGGEKKFQWENLLREIKNNESQHIRKVSIAEVKRNNYRLGVYSYFLDEITVPEGFAKVKLSQILYYNSQRTSLVEKGNILSISDLKDNPFDSPVIFYPTNSNSKKEQVNKRVYYSDNDILLVSLRFKTLKPTYYKVSSHRLYYSPNIAGFYLKEKDAIDINYLIYELNADYVKKQIEALSIGSVMTYIKIQDFLEIGILLPPQDTQHIIVDRAKTVATEEKLEKAGLKDYIQKEKDKYKQVLNIRTHRIRPFLSGLSDNLDLLIDEFQEKEMVKSNDKITSDYSVKDLLYNMKECMVNMKLLIKDLTKELKIGEKESFDIKDFIESYSYKEKSKIINYTINKYFDKESFKIKNNETISYKVLFNKENLREIIDLIIENAELHGFSNKNKTLNEVTLTTSYFPDSGFILLSIKNNGLAMVSDFTEEQYFASGIISGATGNTGIGGFRIKDVVDQLAGKVQLINSPTSEYPVEVQIYLPILL